ncbi:hypothetical protein H5410_018404 [Solanum commersonii]|uniref:Chitin-binding type-1 domain-containing protein n=1 Tax=Solanum commersonii TaxID=4109 RepID=A0A9J6A323_SOLCO|nr:hypothetical protein H5410_018404 [Solanum commersonii]
MTIVDNKANELSLPFHLPINETFQGINNASAGYQGRCGMQGHGGKCPTGLCCSIWGWCGTTSDYCSPGYCQRQCPGPYQQGRCGWQADGGACPTSTGQCCSNAGWCGTTSDYCAPVNCQSQCNTTTLITSPIKNPMRGIQSFKLNVV